MKWGRALGRGSTAGESPHLVVVPVLNQVLFLSSLLFPVPSGVGIGHEALKILLDKFQDRVYTYLKHSETSWLRKKDRKTPPTTTSNTFDSCPTPPTTLRSRMFPRWHIEIMHTKILLIVGTLRLQLCDECCCCCCWTCNNIITIIVSMVIINFSFTITIAIITIASSSCYHYQYRHHAS